MMPRPGGAMPGLAASTSLMVAGPVQGPLDGWAAVVAPLLGRNLPPGGSLPWETVGLSDGVTGANQFEALANPDGSVALLVPSAAVMAWLVGDTRVHFDAAQWIPAMATVSAGLLASRIPVSQMRQGQQVRVAASGPAGPELPALLALDLLKLEVVPVFGVSDASGAIDAVVSNAADIAFLHGRGIAEQAQSLAAAGAPPVLAMGEIGAGPGGRDPLFPRVPTVTDLAGPGSNGALFAAWRAASAAAQIDTALVLPQQTPAAMVAAWRRAAGTTVAAREVSAQAERLGVRLLAPPASTVCLGAAAAPQATLLDLRQWLAERWRWRPA